MNRHLPLSAGSRERFGPWLLLAVLVYVILAKAWVSDDAYITFRVVDNFVNGFGLRWNISERVQVFTNPLWLFIHAPFYALSGEIFLTTILLSSTFTALAFVLAARTFARGPLFSAVFLLLPLALSKSFSDYATSGLENPFTYFALAWFFAVLVTPYTSLFRYLFTLALIAALAAFNRLDTILFFLPVLAFLFFRHRGQKSLYAMLLGFTPLLGWLLFSFFYYGFVFPNTAYAKLGAGLETRLYWQQGLVYAVDLVHKDPLTALWIVSALLLVVYQALNSPRRRKDMPERDWSVLLMGLGLILYCLYILRVGGDFMSGRFWSGPFFLSVLLIAWFAAIAFLPALPQQEGGGIRRLVYAAVGGALMGFYLLFPPAVPDNRIPPSGIHDERAFFKDQTGLAAYLRGVNPARSEWAREAAELRRETRQTGNMQLTVKYGVGLFGYYAGPRVIIIDLWAVADPLLARLPLSPVKGKNWRIGHLARHLPAGYVHFYQTQSLARMHPDLAVYYSRLNYITAGPLFSWRRVKTALDFNLGVYDELLESYVNGVYLPTDSVPDWKMSEPAAD